MASKGRRPDGDAVARGVWDARAGARATWAHLSPRGGDNCANAAARLGRAVAVLAAALNGGHRRGEGLTATRSLRGVWEARAGARVTWAHLCPRGGDNCANAAARLGRAVAVLAAALDGGHRRREGPDGDAVARGVWEARAGARVTWAHLCPRGGDNCANAAARLGRAVAVLAAALDGGHRRGEGLTATRSPRGVWEARAGARVTWAHLCPRGGDNCANDSLGWLGDVGGALSGTDGVAERLGEVGTARPSDPSLGDRLQHARR